MKKSILSMFVLLVATVLTACSGGDADAPQGMQRISNENVDYNLFVPDKWTPETSTGVITAKYSDSIMVNVSMTAATLTDDIANVDDYWAWFQNEFKQNITDWKEESSEEILMDGHAAKKFIYTGSVASVDVKYMQAICIKSGVAYIFTYTAAPDHFDAYVNDANKMIENFTFK